MSMLPVDTVASRLDAECVYSVSIADYEEALQQIKQLETAHQESNKKITSLEEEISRLKEQIRLMQQRHFGKKTEVQVGEAVVDLAENPSQAVSGYNRRKKTRGRLIDTSTLPRYRFYHDLKETEKTCACCHNKLDLLGQESSEQVEVVPLRLYIAEHIRFKYSCRTCQMIKMAPKPPAPIPKAMAGGSLLTEVIVSKYQYHLPLYRQSKIMSSYGAIIPDNTLGNWVNQSGMALIPIYNALWAVILDNSYLQVDETPVQVLKSDKKGYLWVYFAPHIAKGLVIFELSLTRSGTVAETRLKDFKGLLQTDGYTGYTKLRERKDIAGFGCLTHARRKFSEVLKITKDPTGISAQFIERVKPLYALENRMKELKLSFHTRKRLRQKQAWPILKSLYSWLKQQRLKTPPKSKLGEAIQYTLNQWPYLIAYVRHGAAEIDTNGVENIIRPTALGKKNWLFMGNEDSGLIHALWYSLILSALLNGLNPRVYVHYLLSKVHELRTKVIEPATLLPHVIERQRLIDFANEQIALSKRVLNDSS